MAVALPKAVALASHHNVQRSNRLVHFSSHFSPINRCRTPQSVVSNSRHSGFRLSGSWRRQTHVLAALVNDVEGKVYDMDDSVITATGLQKWIIKGERAFNIFATEAVIKILDGLYADRPFPRFYVLETIARVPYFAFVSVLHMYESFGWWRRSDYLKVHFAESWNELHHLLVMEALGGDKKWVDRFLAQHIAVAYFFLTALMYLLSPRMAYHFSECVERHAYHTYDDFIKSHGEELKKLPAPEVAVQYYSQGDLYMFDEFQTDLIPESRRPKVDNLYDVFVNIREDEAQHCKTMHACQTRGNLRSPHSQHAKSGKGTGKGADVGMQDGAVPAPAECAGILECAVTSSSFAKRSERQGMPVDIPIAVPQSLVK